MNSTAGGIEPPSSLPTPNPSPEGEGLSSGTAAKVVFAMRLDARSEPCRSGKGLFA